MRIGRRGFFRALAASVVGLTLARELPGIAPRPFTLPPPPVAIDYGLGLSIRFVRQFDIATDVLVNRFDVFMVPADFIGPELVCRVEGA